MPIISSAYRPPLRWRQTDIMTIYASQLRKVKGVAYERERITLPDTDFIDIDWSKTKKNTTQCIVMLHGLEGSSQSQYMLGMAKLFNQQGFDACAVNFRSCSGELNRLYSCYHSGKTDDLYYLLTHHPQLTQYQQIILCGVSLGANVALKLAGEPLPLPKNIKAIISISAPCDLSGSSKALHKHRNKLYERNFHHQLMKKLKQKQQLFPEKISHKTMASIKNLKDFDELYTAPAHGFKNAEDYYTKSSALGYLPHIPLPTLILNAQNDSFLSSDSYPYHIAEKKNNLYLETPKYGGHVAFLQQGPWCYHEKRALAFAHDHLI